MLAAVGGDSDRYEGLMDYIVGNKRPPTNVPSASVRPRMENRPGEQTPGARSRIPTSSQRPGKRTNDTIPYARVCFTEFHGSAVDPSDVFPGDVVMLHRTSKALGHDTNRQTKVASWRQINALLAQGTSGVLLDGSNTPEILDVRRRELRAIMSTLQSAEVETRRPNINLQRSITRMNTYYDELRGETVELEEGRPTVFLPHVDWKSVPFLNDWSPDGILMSRDDDEQSASFFAAGPGESGVVFNVAVQGPAAVRNTNCDELSQAFDPEPRVMDFLYLLLVCDEVLNASGAFKGFSFRLKPTSGRLLEEATNPNRTWSARPAEERPSRGYLSYDHVSNTVFAWRVGRVLDTNAASGKLRAYTNVFPLSLFDMRERFGSRVGSSVSRVVSLAPTGPSATLPKTSTAFPPSPIPTNVAEPLFKLV